MQRDLGSLDVWAESLERSRARRQAAQEAPAFELPARGASAVALAVLAGGPVAGVAVGHAVSGSDDSASTPPEATEAPAVERASAARPRRLSPPTPAVPKSRIATPQVGPAARPGRRAAARRQPSRVTAPARPRLAGHSTSTTTRTVAAAGSRRPRRGGIRTLQSKLGLPVDGVFGRETEKTLKRWQKAHGLAADGVAGPRTRAALRLGEGPALKRRRVRRARRRRARPASNRRPVRQRRGGGVAALQRALGLSADGVFGPAAERALKRWQRRHGLEPDGVAGPATRKALRLGPGPALKRKRRARRRRSGGSGGGGGGSAVVQRVIAAANRIATKPYRYGGGHGSFTDSGYDCSGSVSYALHGGGLLSSPLDSSGFMSYGRPGPGRHITIYAHPGHMFMVVNGRRFDTSARSQTGSRWAGSMRSTSGYTVRHPAGL